MAVTVKLEELLKERKITAGDLAKMAEIEPAKLSLLKSNKAHAIKFETLDKICRALECQVSDLIEYKE
ncbi:MAG: helix-turn-helix domain-containing protein [Ruminococcus sp.]|nr:helix-turn-helix domain-containing protein [Ruminococcus sp.]